MKTNDIMGELRQRRSATDSIKEPNDNDLSTLQHRSTDAEVSQTNNPCERLTRWMQETSYQVMAYTFWDNIVSGFKPGRIRAMTLLDIQPTDKVLLVGEGSGLDFECLPDTVDKTQLKAFDFSSEMVRQSKIKARQYGIPEDNCFVGDAQHMPFDTEKFDKIFFPLSLGSIPNPHLALQEAERVLAPGGKIVLFEKLVDDEVAISWGRKALNTVTQCVFADINRNLSTMLGEDSSLKMVHYESLADKLEGFFAKKAGAYYRLAVIVRNADFVDQPAIRARLT